MTPRLRPTMLSDLDWVVSVEQDGSNRPFITPWERMQHEGAIRFPDCRHFIVEGGPQGAHLELLLELGEQRGAATQQAAIEKEGRGVEEVDGRRDPARDGAVNDDVVSVRHL